MFLPRAKVVTTYMEKHFPQKINIPNLVFVAKAIFFGMKKKRIFYFIMKKYYFIH